ncbi:hypothetical protein [Kitasatospora purpeofusca]|uniref:thiazole synthase n=1 Tax=Kitasatospora purpeofusca TaxID=67352 RepID=A0ABZ1U570_9ACTN|nr:hypothetical protein [Kitasatospora purpeofusca]
MAGTIDVAGISLSRFWHCFGTERHRASLETVVGLLKASGTNVLPINTHQLDEARDRSALEHGFDGVSYDTLGEHVDTASYVKMLNINLRTSAGAAVDATKIAFEMTGERVLKLEVLNPSLRGSQDGEVVEAARILSAWDPSLIVLPLISNDLDTAKAAVDAGCPLLRVMGSDISSRAGITDSGVFEEICTLGVPVVLDGGIGEVEHLVRAAELGAAGALINSVLFDRDQAPVSVMEEFAAAADRIFGSDL